ncbi:MAG: hypothetical protein LBM71_03610 [Elusimicrobiota bacterium]|jgi:hypothetical protein|nr:hypothetical protein [Elusimicrobiota bacterium]
MKILLITLSFLFLLLPQVALAKTCYTGNAQKKTYEEGLAPTEENETITACLKKSLNAQGEGAKDNFDKTVAALRKSGNIAAVFPEMMQIFKTSKDPGQVFTAAAALISSPSDLPPYQHQLLNLLSSPQAQDYKKTLAAIALIVIGGANTSDYTPFLTPALNAEDAALQAYACGAATLAGQSLGGQYLNQIIQLYTFDKTFAQNAFAKTGLKDSALNAKLKENLKSQSEPLRLAAIEWIGEKENKKLLLNLLDLPNSFNDGEATLPAAAAALAANYQTVSTNLKKAMKNAPKSFEASVATMAYALVGSNSFNQIDELLKNGSEDEKANSLRVIASSAAILKNDAAHYQNPELEKDRIKRFIEPVGQLANNTASKEIKPYADTTLKGLYNLLND